MIPVRLESFKAKVRSYEYCIASDGPLVLMMDTGETCFRPVVSVVPYEALFATLSCVWEHLSPGTNHNVVTGAHCRPEGLYRDFDVFVVWLPPESFTARCLQCASACFLSLGLAPRPRNHSSVVYFSPLTDTCAKDRLTGGAAGGG